MMHHLRLLPTPLLFLFGSVNMALAQPSAIDNNFLLYCSRADSVPWHCASRRGSQLSPSLKWEIVDGYCFDVERSQRPSSAAARSSAVAALQDGRGPLCTEHLKADPPMTLAYDHNAGLWASANDGFTAHNRRLELDPVSRRPRAHLVKSDTIAVVVTETNPLLYATAAGAASEVTVGEVEELGKFVGLLGGTLASFLGTAPPVAPPPSNPLAPFAGASPNVASSDPDLTLVSELTRAVRSPLATVRGMLAKLAAQRTNLVTLAQALERGPAWLDTPLDASLEDARVWQSAFGALGSALASGPNAAGCSSSIKSFVELVPRPVDKAAKLHAAAQATVQALSHASTSPPCAALQLAPRLVTASSEIARAAERVAMQPDDTAAAEELNKALGSARGLLAAALSLSGALTEFESTRTAASLVADKVDDAVKLGATTGIVAARVRSASRRKDGDRTLVTNRIFLSEETYLSTWTKARVAPITVSMSSPYADAVAVDRPREVASSYELVRRGIDRLHLGAGVIHTRAYSAVFGARDADPARNVTVTTDDVLDKTTTRVVQPELKEVFEKDRLPRAGSVAAFINYRLFGSDDAGLGLQLGTATSPENPAFMGGLSATLGKFATVGVGVGRFRVKRLHPNQAAAVGSADDIQVVNVWTKPTGYVSVSLNVDSLPFFK